jgi:hypothetical protein
MGKRTQGSRRLDHVDRQSQVGVSGAMRARDVSRPSDDDVAAADPVDDEASPTDQPAGNEPGKA